MALATYTSKEYIGDGKTVGMQFRCTEQDQKRHRHDFIEIVYILEGEGVEWVDERSYTAKKGDLFVIGQGSTHAFTTEKSISFYEIFFSPDLVSSGAVTVENALPLLAFSIFTDMRKEKSNDKMTFFGEERREIESIVSSMYKECQTGEVDAPAVLVNYLNILLTKMRRHLHTSADSGIFGDVWESMRAYIDEHPEEQITLSHLAAKSFYNPSYLSRMFKQKFGRSPTEYIRMRRIERACALLSAGDASVEEIMAQAGFSDRSSFYHAFAEETGMTPGEYRTQNGKK